MINLLDETRNILKEHGKMFSDIIFVGDSDTHTRMSVESFIANADFEYYNGYGAEYINTSLILVGKDFWLERQIYDGSEWWEYKAIPNVEDYTNGSLLIQLFYDETNVLL